MTAVMAIDPANGQDQVVSIRRRGCTFSYRCLPGSTLIAVAGGYVVAHPDHPPVMVTEHGAEPARLDPWTNMWGKL